MRNVQLRRRSSPWSFLSFALLLLLTVGGGTVATLVMLGVPMPWTTVVEPPRVRIPMNARPLPAYAMVGRDDLVDPQKRALAFLELRPDQAIGMSLVTLSPEGEEIATRVTDVLVESDGIIYVTAEGEQVPAPLVYKLGKAYMQPGDVIGRVLSREKQPGFGFTEDSFLPKGTRPGIAGGTPAGMQAITIEASKINGVHAIRAGDRVDLLATVPEEHLARYTPGDNPRLPGAALVVKGASKSKTTAGEVRLVASEAVLVTPVTMRAAPATSTSLTQGKRVTAVPVQEVVVAVQPDDVALLTEALSQGLPITATLHSGRPDADAQRDAVPEGMVAVPVSSREIEAFTSVVKDDLVDHKTRRPRTMLVGAEQAAERGAFISPLDIAGRVTARDLPPGHVFSEADFLPPGTPTGLAGGIPAGKRAYVVETGKVQGIASLARGDRFDVVANRAIELPSGRDGQKLYSLSGSPAKLRDEATTQVVVSGGVVLVPAADAATEKERKTQEVIVAVEPEEVEPLSEMLALKVALTAVARSGQASDDGRNLMVSNDHPLREAKTLETVVGGKRSTMIFVPTGMPLAEQLVKRSPLDETVAPATRIEEAPE
jgi:Flp pilus assembly protein CpaB